MTCFSLLSIAVVSAASGRGVGGMKEGGVESEAGLRRATPGQQTSADKVAQLCGVASGVGGSVGSNVGGGICGGPAGHAVGAPTSSVLGGGTGPASGGGSLPHPLFASSHQQAAMAAAGLFRASLGTFAPGCHAAGQLQALPAALMASLLPLPLPLRAPGGIPLLGPGSPFGNSLNGLNGLTGLNGLGLNGSLFPTMSQQQSAALLSWSKLAHSSAAAALGVTVSAQDSGSPDSSGRQRSVSLTCLSEQS